MDWYLDLIEEFAAFKFYRRPTYPGKCLVEEGVPNSRSGDKGISQWQWNLQHLRVYVGDVEYTSKGKV